MIGWPDAPVVYGVDTWPWLKDIGASLGDVPAEVWEEAIPPGTDAVWHDEQRAATAFPGGRVGRPRWPRCRGRRCGTTARPTDCANIFRSFSAGVPTSRFPPNRARSTSGFSPWSRECGKGSGRF
jgi:hypothetical protein